MAKIVVKSAKFGIVVKELDTANYQHRAVLIRDLLQAIPDADWFEEKLNDDNAARIRIPANYRPSKRTRTRVPVNVHTKNGNPPF